MLVELWICVHFFLSERKHPECKCMRDEQNQESGSDTGSVLAKKRTLIFIFLPCAILSLKALEERAPVMQREQLWCKLMQPVNILVCIHQKSLS